MALRSEEVRKIVEEEVNAHGTDIAMAASNAETRIRQLAEFPMLVDQLVTDAVRELVYDARHRLNVTIKRQTGQYGQPRRVASAESSEVQLAYRGVYAYHVGGKTLGELMGCELEGIARQEQAKADGHRFNARLLDWLRPLVRAERKVSECVSERRLREGFDRLYRETMGHAAEAEAS